MFVVQSVLPKHYHIDMTPVPSSRPEMGFEVFDAKVSVSLEFVSSATEIVLNSLRLRISKCEFKGEVVAFRLLPEKSQLVVDLGKEVPAGSSGELVIEFSGDVATDSLGIYQNSYQNGKRRGIGTQFEMIEARRMLPCFDEPSFKVRFFFLSLDHIYVVMVVVVVVILV